MLKAKLLLEKLVNTIRQYVASFTEDRLFGAKRSSQWPKVRAEFLKTHQICAVCGTKKELEVHHKIPVNIDQSKEFEISNLITLCDTDHFTFGHLKSWRSFNKDVKRDACIWRAKIEKRP